MARIVLGSYMVRYPLGGMLSWVLQYIIGFQKLGHEIYFVEKFGYENACYHPIKEEMSNDCAYGLQVLKELLKPFGLENNWCFVQYGDLYHGLSKTKVEEIFRTADLFIDMGSHGSWAEESEGCQMRVLIDGEPAFTQIKMSHRLEAGEQLSGYDHYFTNGMLVGTDASSSPTASKNWKHVLHPVNAGLFEVQPPPKNAAFSTVMNWRSHAPIQYKGKTFGQKDLEFEKIIELPNQTSAPLEIAVSGKKLPLELLKSFGWQIEDGRAMTLSYERFKRYILDSYAELTVCKQVFVANRTGWFSDRSSAYLASGRPVILQDTGYSDFLPVGEGLFAFTTSDEALTAIDEIRGNHAKHSKKAREIACDLLDAKWVLKEFCHELGIS
ncbi:MAG: hypothetical protein R8P61_06915 [Bacteroidia bacterium]|nr:hypothetical protein [Bacteroidia bacterium]